MEDGKPEAKAMRSDAGGMLSEARSIAESITEANWRAKKAALPA